MRPGEGGFSDDGGVQRIRFQGVATAVRSNFNVRTKVFQCGRKDESWGLILIFWEA